MFCIYLHVMVKTKLQELRLQRGFSQEEIADLLGMTQSNYSRKENGVTRISAPEWNFIAKKLDVNIEDIYEPEETTIIYKNNKGNSFNSGTINIHVPDFVFEYIETIKEQNQLLKQENEVLKSQLDKK